MSALSAASRHDIHPHGKIRGERQRCPLRGGDGEKGGGRGTVRREDGDKTMESGNGGPVEIFIGRGGRWVIILYFFPSHLLL